MAASNICSHLDYLDKLVDEYNDTYRSIGKKPADADYSALTEEIETNLKASQFKVGERVRITKNIFWKGYTNNWSREIVVIDSEMRTYPWTYKIKNLNREKIIGLFYKKEFLLSKL